MKLLVVTIMFALATLPALAGPKTHHVVGHNMARKLGAAITPTQAEALLSAQGLAVGTIRFIPNFGRLRVDGLKYGAEGRWIVIRILTTRLP